MNIIPNNHSHTHSIRSAEQESQAG